jgi:hypothetical protein
MLPKPNSATDCLALVAREGKEGVVVREFNANDPKNLRKRDKKS